MFALRLISATTRPMTATDHRRRLEASDLYQRRELDGHRAVQWSRLKALLYLSPDYYEQFPAVTPRVRQER
jgi:hypothetical protein